MIKKNTPIVSVIMATYNSESTIKESIESILSQKYKNFEFLILDDCSSDNTLRIIKSYQKIDERIKIFENKKNIGLTKSLNLLIKRSSGEYLARQDADDISYEQRLEKQIDFCIKNNIKAVVTRAINMSNGKKIPRYSYFIPYKYLIKFKNPFVHGTLLIKKELMLSVGGYNEEYYYAQDYKLFKDLTVKKEKIGKIWDPLYLLNTKDNISNNFKKEQKKYANKVKRNK